MKRDVKLASGIMLVALIGLLSFQAYWISSIYKENRQSFEADAQSALTAANQSLLIKKLGVLGGLDIDLSDETAISITYSNDDDEFGISSSFNFNTGSPFHMRKGSRSGSDTVYVGGSFRKKFAMMGESNKLLPILSNSYSDLSMFDFEYLDSLVSQNLQVKGLNKNYFLGFWDNGHSRFAYTNKDIRDSTYRTDGFKVNSFAIGTPGTSELHLDFPEREIMEASLAGMGPVIGASILMLILLLSAWYYIVRSLQKQYRLAQIKDDFIGNMTHELKTPVTASSLALEVMSKNEKIDHDEKLSELVAVAQGEQKRILEIINSILDNTSAEESIQENVENINAFEELEMIAESMRLKVEERHGKLQVSLPKIDCAIRVNHMHFQNAILNILDNAIKYSQIEPRISLTGAATLTDLEISIADEGIGITKEDQKRVFDKFFRVHTGNVHTVKGYGLGLSYTKKVIEEFGGAIAVTSNRTGGTTFRITLPIAPDES